MNSVILTYHSIDATGSVISIEPAAFRSQMRFLAVNRVPVVPLTDICKTPGGVALTFDDGFENFFAEAFPVLQEFHFPATVFVVSNYCGLRNVWPSQPRSGIPPLKLMGWRQLMEISRLGISLGAHTVTHPRLGAIPEKQVRQELIRCRSTIQERTGKAVEGLAYPYGESTPRVRSIAEQCFQAAYGTRPAFIAGTSDPMDMPRVDAYYLRNRLWFESMRSVRGRLYVAARRSLRAVRNAAGAPFSMRAAG